MISYIKFLKNFKSFINATNSGRRKNKNGTNITKGTINCYKCIYKLIIKYEIYTETELVIPILRNSTRKDYLEVREHWLMFQKRYLSFLFREKNHFDNYVSLNNKVLRTFLNWVKSEKGYDLGDFRGSLYIQNEEPPIITFSVNQLKFLMQDKTFHNSLSPALQRSKNILVFGCLTGLRYSDMMTIQQEHIKNMDNEVYLDLYSQKTGTAIMLKLPPQAIQLLSELKCSRNRLLPKLALATFNRNIKKITQLAGWTYTIRKSRKQRGISKSIHAYQNSSNDLRFCDLVSSHIMRRTAITNLLMLGVPELVVKKYSGHSINSKSFGRYVNLAQTYMDKELGNAFDKLEEV